MSTPWRVVAAQVVRAASAWGRASNERAVEHARTAAVQASRSAVERAEVQLWLAGERATEQADPVAARPVDAAPGPERPPYVAVR